MEYSLKFIIYEFSLKFSHLIYNGSQKSIYKTERLDLDIKLYNNLSFYQYQKYFLYFHFIDVFRNLMDSPSF